MIIDTRSTGFSVVVAVAISLVLSAGLLANVSFMYGIAFFIPGFLVALAVGEVLLLIARRRVAAFAAGGAVLILLSGGIDPTLAIVGVVPYAIFVLVLAVLLFKNRARAASAPVA